MISQSKLNSSIPNLHSACGLTNGPGHFMLESLVFDTIALLDLSAWDTSTVIVIDVA